MLKSQILCILAATTGTGTLIGVLLIVAAYLVSSRVLVRDLSEQMEKRGVRNPRLIELMLRAGYVATVTGCLIILLSVVAALAGILIMVLNGRFWFDS